MFINRYDFIIFFHCQSVHFLFQYASRTQSWIDFFCKGSPCYNINKEYILSSHNYIRTDADYALLLRIKNFQCSRPFWIGSNDDTTHIPPRQEVPVWL